MKQFTAIDFETGNPQRVSACEIGFAFVEDGNIVNSGSYLIKPVGGHAPFQTRIHGITEEDTKNQPMFNEVFPLLQPLLGWPIVGHSSFDKQVLNALDEYFSLKICFEYFDSSSMAKEKLPELSNYKLDTVAKHLGLPEFKHHSAKDDAITCANIVIKLEDMESKLTKKVYYSKKMEYYGLISGIIADEQVNYKEAYNLLYWMEDNPDVAAEYSPVFCALKNFCSDGEIDQNEERILIRMLENERKNIINK